MARLAVAYLRTLLRVHSSAAASVFLIGTPKSAEEQANDCEQLSGLVISSSKVYFIDFLSLKITL